MADLTTIADLGTASGTLVLAVATFASVRSGNRAARIAEESLLNGMRPLLVSSRLEAPPEKVGFQDGYWVRVEGGRGIADVTDAAIYFAMSLRNVGSGLAVLHGWQVRPEKPAAIPGRPEPSQFRRLTRDLFIAPGDTGFWQGALRDPTAEDFLAARKAIEAGEIFTVDLLYGDYEGGQRVITRFGYTPVPDAQPLVSVGRHWNVDRPDPR